VPVSDLVATSVTIKVDGANVEPTVYDDLRRVTVEDSLFLPAMFEIELYDAELKWADHAMWSIGKQVDISYTGDTVTKPAITGEITSLEPMLERYGPYRFVIRGYHKVHRLHHRNHVKTYIKRKDSEIVSEMAGTAGLSADVQDTAVLHEALIQDNQTDWEFICARARRIGYVVLGRATKLTFKSITELTSAVAVPVTLKDDILEFYPRFTATGSQKNVVARGWDVKTKQAIAAKGMGAALSVTGLGQGSAKAVSAGIAPNADWVSTGHTTVTTNEGMKIANGLAIDIAAGDIQAEGVINGNPKLLAGGMLQVKGAGTRFSGKYLLSSVSHEWSPEEGYRTSFKVAGLSGDTVADHILGGAANRDGSRANRTHAIAVVTQNEDPDGMGRIKVKYPWLSDDQESGWIRMAVPMAGPSRGMMILPEINDEVLIAFEHGDLNQPISVGMLWNGKDKPPLATGVAVKNGSVIQRIWKSRLGHFFLFDDSDNAAGIQIVDKTGKNKITIDSINGAIEILADAKITMKSREIILEATQKMTVTAQLLEVESKTDAKYKVGTKLDMKANAGVNIESSATMGLKATATMSIESTAPMTVKSNATLQVEATGPAMVKGNPIKLN
jgi:uncharacterized protein involved in type VI secretion and phage assembly